MSDFLDQFRKLEEKLLKVSEAFKQSRAEYRELQEELDRLRAEYKERAKRWDVQEKDLEGLRREREDVRERIEKLIEHIDVLTKAERAG